MSHLLWRLFVFSLCLMAGSLAHCSHLHCCCQPDSKPPKPESPIISNCLAALNILLCHIERGAGQSNTCLCKTSAKKACISSAILLVCKPHICKEEENIFVCRHLRISWDGYENMKNCEAHCWINWKFLQNAGVTTKFAMLYFHKFFEITNTVSSVKPKVVMPNRDISPHKRTTTKVFTQELYIIHLDDWIFCVPLPPPPLPPLFFFFFAPNSAAREIYLRMFKVLQKFFCCRVKNSNPQPQSPNHRVLF